MKMAGDSTSDVVGESWNDMSVMNRFSPPSTSSSEELRCTGHGISETHNRRLVQEIINKIFDERSGAFEASASECSSAWQPSSEYSFDRRLKYWKEMVSERKRIATTIKSKTGKLRDDVLFNRPVTVDEREKDMVKRLMNYAQRMNPLVLRNRQAARMSEVLEPVQPTWQDRCIDAMSSGGAELKNELIETLPRAERVGCVAVEITGLPSHMKIEQIGPPVVAAEMHETRHSSWLKSSFLEQRIEEQRKDIERVIEHFPDISRLEVIGEGVQKPRMSRQSSGFQLLGDECIECISSDSTVAEVVVNQKTMLTTEPSAPVDYAIIINDNEFTLQPKRNAKNVDMEISFGCEPFQRDEQHALLLQNTGVKMLDCEWSQRSPYEKAPMLLKPLDNEFVTDRASFRLSPGEMRRISIVFQPRKVGVVREKWSLKLCPQFFCRRMDTVLLRLIGHCWPSPEYSNKLDEVQLIVIEKSNLKMTRKLTTGLGVLTPHLAIGPEVLCPYKRSISEREIFALQNTGYTCGRYHDLELLRNLYKRAKKPREHVWDLRLDTLRATIMRVEQADNRRLLFAEMLGILDGMKSTQPNDDDEFVKAKPMENSDRNRARFVFVRGLIASVIDDWEELTVAIEEAFLKPAMKRYLAQMDWLGTDMEIEKRKTLPNTKRPTRVDPVLLLEDEVAIKKVLWRKNASCKAFRDSLLMQTYTMLCNFVEDMVSTIESTEVI